LNARGRSILEWLPQETMLYDGANAQSETTIHLDQAASFIGWDMLVLGRQARAETFSDGAYRNIFTLHRDQKLLVADTLRFTGNDRWLRSCL
ncbi:urease accessory protein UreD, partial [Acinetobacter baumannii]